MFGEQRRGDDRERGVLVACWANGAGERNSALDDELCWGSIAWQPVRSAGRNCW